MGETSVDLSTTYLGLQLPHPIIPGASPLADDLDVVRRLVDAGAPAIVLRSLFEEQILNEQRATTFSLELTAETSAEALSYFPRPREFALGVRQYVAQIERIKRITRVPVIASLNGVTLGGWVRYARQMQNAGADALELNVYYLASDPTETGASVERRSLEILRAVKQVVTIPVAVKLSPFISAMACFAAELEMAGADGLILFNRFYQPDFDIQNLDVSSHLQLSSSAELLLRLRWLAILSSQVGASLAASGGVHTALDAIKAVMAGANVVQLVSALLLRGPEYLGTVRSEMAQWMEERGYTSLEQMRGSMNLARCSNPAAFERANYARVLQTWFPVD